MSSSLKWRSRFDHLAEKFGALPESSDCRDKRQYRILQKIPGSIFREDVGKRILDVGCGNGGMSESVPTTNMVYCLDLSFKILQVARDKKRIAVNSDALHLPIGDSSIDAVISFGFLQLLNSEDGLQCISEFNRVTKKGGVLVLSTMNGESLLHRLHRNHVGKYFEKRYCFAEINQLLLTSGFVVEEMYYFYPPLSLFSKGLNFGNFRRLFASTFVFKARKK